MRQRTEKQTFHQGLCKLDSNQITFNQQKKKIDQLTSTTDSTKHPSNLTVAKGNVSSKRVSANMGRREREPSLSGLSMVAPAPTGPCFCAA